MFMSENIFLININNFILFRSSSEQPCASVTCHNGGTCKHSDAGMWCECQPGFSGPLCDTGKVLKLNRNIFVIFCFLQFFVVVANNCHVNIH